MHLIKMKKRSANARIICMLIFLSRSYQKRVDGTSGQTSMVREYETGAGLLAFFYRNPNK